MSAGPWDGKHWAAPDNNSVQTAGALKYQTAIRPLSAQGRTVEWVGRKFKDRLYQAGTSLGILAGCINTHAATPSLTHSVFPLLLGELQLSAVIKTCDSAFGTSSLLPSSQNASKCLLKHHDTICKYRFSLPAAFLHISATLNSSHPYTKVNHQLERFKTWEVSS